jgi:hypothetical protein
LDFQPFRTEIHYGLIKKLVKIQFIYVNIKILKTTFLQLA